MAEPVIIKALDAVEIEPWETSAPRSSSLKAGASGSVPWLNLRVPYLPVKPQRPLDEYLFDNPTDPSKKHYIPRFRISLYSDPGGGEHHTAYLDMGREYILTVLLEPYQADAIRDQARNATPISDLTFKVGLQYKWLDGSPRVKEFQELKQIGDKWQATLRLSAKADKDEIDVLLNNSNIQPYIEVSRAFTVGIPSDPQPDFIKLHEWKLAALESSRYKILDLYEHIPFMETRRAGSFEVIMEIVKGQYPPNQGDLISYKSADGKSVLCRVQYNPLFPTVSWEHINHPILESKMIFVERNYSFFSGVPGEKFSTNFVSGSTICFHTLKDIRAEEKAGRIRECQVIIKDLRMFDLITEPLKSSELLSKKDIKQRSQQVEGLILHQIGSHRYFQIAKKPDEFFYLPDYFDICSRDGIPRLMRIEATADPDKYTVDFAAFPRVDVNGRLKQHGSNELLIEANRLLNPPVQRVTLKPLLGPDPKVEVKFFLNVPRGNDLQGKLEDHTPKISITPHSKIGDRFLATQDEVVSLIESMLGTSNVLFIGTVKVKLGELEDHIAFKGRVPGGNLQNLDKLLNAIYTGERKETARQITVRADRNLFNQIKSLEVSFERGDTVTLTLSKLEDKARAVRTLEVMLGVEKDEYIYHLKATKNDGTLVTRDKRGGDDVLPINSISS